MTNDRDMTRIVRSWLEDGSTAIPDRVLDAVLAELPSTPQRRSWWPLRRFVPMKPFLTIAGAAVAVVLVVVLGSALLPRISGVGAPSGEQPITGEAKFMLGGGEVTLVVDAGAEADRRYDERGVGRCEDACRPGLCRQDGRRDLAARW